MAETSLQGIWTQKGLDKETAFRAGGTRKALTHVAVGDGNGTIPLVSASQTGLVHEVWRGLANAVMANPDDPTDLLVDVVIPNNVGGFWIREWGIFDEDGELVAVGPHDEMHKPLISTGQAAEFLERFHLPSANASFVEIKIASQALASQQYVESEIAAHDADLNAHGMLARKSVEIIAGTGLSGGGPLSSDVTLSAKLDGKTTQAAADGAITVKDVAIGGDLGDLASARGQIGDYRTKLPAGTDLNDIISSGTYIVYSGNCTNVPMNGMDGYYVLRVFGDATNPNAAVQKIYSRMGTAGPEWSRRRISDGTWQPWQQLVQTNYIGDGVRVSRSKALPDGTGGLCILSVPEYEGATASTAGTSGLVPAADAGQHESFLTGGGEYKPALSTGGGVMTGSIQINDLENAIGAAPSTNTERGLFLGDKNSVIMGGFDVIQRASDNAKYTQFYSKNSSGHITSIAAVTYEDGTRELVADSPLQINDIQIKQVVDGGRRVIVLSGARGKQGHSFRFSPDTGEAYMDGRVIHAKADTAGYADTAGSA
ncbi:phage tail protein, partial [Bilophila wadsworthia]|uniref:phage tail-collar fiber domain-containing protein n=2 Tax=Bilophila wadsworthia TaxID=35833 RepID=UPI0004980E51